MLDLINSVTEITDTISSVTVTESQTPFIPNTADKINETGMIINSPRSREMINDFLGLSIEEK